MKSNSVEIVPVFELYGHSRKVHALEYNSDSTLIASGSVDRAIRIWHADTEREETELRGHTDVVRALAWDPTNAYRLASASADKTVRIWDVKTGKIAHSISLPSEVSSITYRKDGRYIVASKEDCIMLICTQKYRMVRKVVNPFESHEVKFSPSGLLFVAAGNLSGHGEFAIMRIDAEKKGNPTLENVHKVVAHAGSCLCLDFHPSGRSIAVGGVDSLVSIWDLEELYCIRTVVVTSNVIRKVRFNHDGRLLAIGIEELKLIIVFADTGNIAASIALQNEIGDLVWHPTKNKLSYVGDKSSHEKDANRDGVIKCIEIKES